MNAFLLGVKEGMKVYIGKDKVVELIDSEAGMDITFSEYPREETFIPSLMEKMKKMIAEF